MSNIELHSPLVSFAGVDSLPFRSTHTRPSTSSAPQVINLIDDDADTNGPPPAVRRRLAGPVSDDDVVIVDPDTSASAENSTSTGGRRISIGGVNRPIVVPDSDEEHSPTRNASTSTQHQRRDSYRIFSPPPPAPTYHPIPPVPSLPIIANPQPFAILAPQNPEESNTSSRRRLPFDETPQPSTSSSSSSSAALPSASALASASRRGNRPGIQLGGGLVSQSIRPRRGAHTHSGWPGSQTQSNDATSRHNHAPADGPSLPVARIVATFLNHDPQQHERNLNLNQNNNHHHHHDFPHHAHAGSWFHPRRAGRLLETAYYILSRNRNETVAAAIPPVPEYTKDMTHPGIPPPGWSFSFGPEIVQSVDVDVDDIDGGGTTNVTAPAEYLACALCLDPLYANVEERRDLSVEERRKKRVWALRCGHMFDGKCIENLMVPNWQKEKPKVPTTEEDEKAKEKEKEVEEEDKKVVVIADEEELGKDEPAKDKGKGKAKEEENAAAEPLVVEEVDVVESAPAPSSTPVTIIDDTPPSSQPESTSGSRYNFRTRRPPLPPPGQPTSSRSTRRTRFNAGAGAASASTSALPGATATIEQPARKPRGTKRKHDGKAVKTNEPRKVEIRYNWTCPVAGCGMMHSSYKLQDVWKPDEEFGPIAIYI